MTKPATQEHQLVEWKQSWRDEYLRWLCGFANAEGGMLVIGRDDQGNVVGVGPLRTPGPTFQIANKLLAICPGATTSCS